MLTAPGQFVLEQMPQQLHRHVLEGQGGAVGKRLQVQRRGLAGHLGLLQLLQGNDGAGAKDRFGVGPVAQVAQVSRRNVVNVKREHLIGQRRIALCMVSGAPAA